MSAPPAAPLRPSQAQPRGCLATLAVALVMVGVVGGGFLAMGAVASLPDQPIEVARGVIVSLPGDWEFAARADDNTVVISRGNASMAILVADGTDERAALAGLRDEWLALGSVTAGEIVSVEGVHGGRPAARFSYFGTFPEVSGGAVEGEVTGVRGTSIVVLFDAWAGEGEFVNARGEVAEIIAEATIP